MAIEEVFDVCEAYYWYSADYHEGQFSEAYKIGCAVQQKGYRPSPLATKPEPDSGAELLYNELVAKAETVQPPTLKDFEDAYKKAAGSPSED